MRAVTKNRRVSRQGRKFDKSAIKRQAILDAAARIFCEKGYAETRLSDIAESIGTKAGGIYYHFESREQLVEEVLAGSMSLISGEVIAALNKLPKGASYKLKMHTAIMAHVNQLLVHDDYMMAYYKLYDQVPEDIRLRYSHLPRRYGDLWKELLEGAAVAGEIRSDLNLSTIRMLLIGSITWTLEWYKKGQLTPEEIGKQLSSMFFDGMSTRPEPSRLRPELEELVNLMRDQTPEVLSSVVQTIRLLRDNAKS